MSIESNNSSFDKHSLFASLSNEDIFNKANASRSLSELKTLRILIVDRAIFGEPNEFVDNIAIFIESKIDAFVQQELSDMVVIESMEQQFGD